MRILPFDRRFAQYDLTQTPGLAVMAIKNGKVKFKKGYGLRNLASKEKVDCDTNFRVASISKQFTAMCIAILEEQGKLSSNDHISQYFSDLPDYMSEIRIYHLVHHLSGLSEYGDALWSNNKSKPLISNHDIYNFYKKQKNLDFKAGDKFEYSNGGYSLLALVIEHATGQSFPNAIEKNIFKPAGMKNSAVIEYPSKIRNQALSYSQWPFFEDIDFNTGNAIYGEDGVYSSLTDFEAWIHALESNVLISPTMTEKVFSPARTDKGNKVDYGYGWGFEEFNGHKMIVHTGLWVGFNSIIAHLPDQKLWFVAFSNSQAIDSCGAVNEMAKYYLEMEEQVG